MKVFLVIVCLFSIVTLSKAQDKNEVRLNVVRIAKYGHYYGGGATGYHPGFGFNVSYSRRISTHYWIKIGGSKIHLDTSKDPFSAEIIKNYDAPLLNLTEFYLSGERNLIQRDKILLKGEVGIASLIIEHLYTYWKDQDGSITFYQMTSEPEIALKTALNAFYKINDRFRVSGSIEYNTPLNAFHSFEFKTGLTYIF